MTSVLHVSNIRCADIFREEWLLLAQAEIL
uniref:Uncharacterized protein n=1 Tax=Arundo donax TaxID=35708 RepID=A0A0A9CHF1_ARUDO